MSMGEERNPVYMLKKRNKKKKSKAKKLQSVL